MAREVIEPESFESGSALLEVLGAEDYEGESHAGAAFEKLNLDLRVVSYVEQEDDDGEFIGTEFTDGAYYKEGKNGAFGIPLRGKLPELLKAMKDEDYFAGIRSGRITFDPDELIGCRFRASVEMNDDGYSKILWNTIKPARKRTSQKAAEKAAEKAEDQNAEALKEAEKSSSKAKTSKAKSSATTRKEKQKAAEKAAAAKTDAEIEAEAGAVLGEAS
jgi:hypothetical protein